MSQTPTPYGDRLRAAMDAFGPFCPGIDPHAALLEQWGLPDTVAGLETFAMTCVEAFGGAVAAVKPQSAFFERFGSAGVAVLERTLAGLRDAGTLSLLDVKRGDIGTTMAGYAQAYLSDRVPAAGRRHHGQPLPRLRVPAPGARPRRRDGSGRVRADPDVEPRGPVGAARDPRRGERRGIRRGGRGPRQRGCRGIRPAGTASGWSSGRRSAARSPTSGSTSPARPAPCSHRASGAQGGTAAALRATFGSALPQVLGTSSREVLVAGPDAVALRDAARRAADDLTTALAG